MKKKTRKRKGNTIWQVHWETCTFQNSVSIQSALYNIGTNPYILEYGLNFPPTSCHKYELVFLSKMFSREIEIDFLVCCNTVLLILTPATPNFSCSQKKKRRRKNWLPPPPPKKKKNSLIFPKQNKQNKINKTIHKDHPLLFFPFLIFSFIHPISWVTRFLAPLYIKN